MTQNIEILNEDRGEVLTYELEDSELLTELDADNLPAPISARKALSADSNVDLIDALRSFAFDGD